MYHLQIKISFDYGWLSWDQNFSSFCPSLEISLTHIAKIKGYRYTLLDIGLVINQLMGHGYCSNYARRKFRSEYCSHQEKFASQFPAKTNTVVSFEPNGQVSKEFRHTDLFSTILVYLELARVKEWRTLQINC